MGKGSSHTFLYMFGLQKIVKLINVESFTREHLFKGKYYCTANLLFILFGLSCFANVELASALLVSLNPNQSNKRSAVQ